MKNTTCKEMGGCCDAVITGNTAEEWKTNGHTHLNSMTDEAHVAVKKGMEEGGPEAAAKWEAENVAKFSSAPEADAAPVEETPEADEADETPAV